MKKTILLIGLLVLLVGCTPKSKDIGMLITKGEGSNELLKDAHWKCVEYEKVEILMYNLTCETCIDTFSAEVIDDVMVHRIEGEKCMNITYPRDKKYCRNGILHSAIPIEVIENGECIEEVLTKSNTYFLIGRKKSNRIIIYN